MMTKNQCNPRLTRLYRTAITGLLAFTFLFSAAITTARDLASWNDSPSRQNIIAFVKAVTNKKSPDYVPVADRIAVFDNDGTLWTEQPLYFQAVFMLEQLKASGAPQPDMRDQKALLEALLKATSGITTDEYDSRIRHWVDTARHPKFNQRYTDLVYAPMQELLEYLRANGFKTFIVSGGSEEFMRPWAEKAYGIPPEQIIGTEQGVTLEMRDGKPVMVRLPNMTFVDDGAGKPIGIYRHIGKRPIAAFGNSDGDLQMLQYIAAGQGRNLVLVVRHDDAEREFAYDRQSKIGHLDKALDEATAKGWTVVSMKNDWKRIYPFDKAK
jgi:hypothetical protein